MGRRGKAVRIAPPPCHASTAYVGDGSRQALFPAQLRPSALGARPFRRPRRARGLCRRHAPAVSFFFSPFVWAIRPPTVLPAPATVVAATPIPPPPPPPAAQPWPFEAHTPPPPAGRVPSGVPEQEGEPAAPPLRHYHHPAPPASAAWQGQPAGPARSSPSAPRRRPPARAARRLGGPFASWRRGGGGAEGGAGRREGGGGCPTPTQPTPALLVGRGVGPRGRVPVHAPLGGGGGGRLGRDGTTPSPPPPPPTTHTPPRAGWGRASRRPAVCPPASPPQCLQAAASPPSAGYPSTAARPYVSYCTLHARPSRRPALPFPPTCPSRLSRPAAAHGRAADGVPLPVRRSGPPRRGPHRVSRRGRTLWCPCSR